MTKAERTWMVLGFVLAGLLVMVCVLLNKNIDEAAKTNALSQEADDDRLRAEYQRILIGCNTAGAITSDDPDLRELCEEYLPELKERL